MADNDRQKTDKINAAFIGLMDNIERRIRRAFGKRLPYALIVADPDNPLNTVVLTPVAPFNVKQLAKALDQMADIMPTAKPARQPDA